MESLRRWDVEDGHSGPNLTRSAAREEIARAAQSRAFERMRAAVTGASGGDDFRRALDDLLYALGGPRG